MASFLSPSKATRAPRSPKRSAKHPPFLNLEEGSSNNNYNAENGSSFRLNSPKRASAKGWGQKEPSSPLQRLDGNVLAPKSPKHARRKVRAPSPPPKVEGQRPLKSVSAPTASDSYPLTLPFMHLAQSSLLLEAQHVAAKGQACPNSPMRSGARRLSRKFSSGDAFPTTMTSSSADVAKSPAAKRLRKDFGAGLAAKKAATGGGARR